MLPWVLEGDDRLVTVAIRRSRWSQGQAGQNFSIKATSRFLYFSQLNSFNLVKRYLSYRWGGHCLFALRTSSTLLGGFGLLTEDGLGQTSKTLELSVVTPRTLDELGHTAETLLCLLS